MLRRWFGLAVLVFAVFAFACPRVARADVSTAHSVSVAVLAFDSDDAEDQAEAITGALRSRIRASQGWSLVETTQSLGMLTAALRCPAKPISAECEQRIADQLKTERYIYGYVSKGPKAGQVTAEVHLYQKNKPDSIQRESFSDNLKDQNDEFLRSVAGRLLDALGGAAVGTIVVRAGSENGEVVIDGAKHIPLKDGTARLDVSPGGHSVEIAVTGRPSSKRNVLITAGKETVVHLHNNPQEETPKADKPFPVRKVIGGGLIALGLTAGIVSLVSISSYGDAQDKGKALQASTNPQDAKLPPGKTANDVCGKSGGLDAREAICRANDDANRNSTVAWVAGGLGGALVLAGVYFLVFDNHDKEAATKAASAKKRQLLPSFSPNGGSVLFSQTF